MKTVNTLSQFTYLELQIMIDKNKALLKGFRLKYHKKRRLQHNIKALTAEQFRRAEMIPTNKLMNDLGNPF